ncbi:hypothetical protein MAPG_08728 [Magnaporthiopsis poae ATCC 64411]|uniref:Uncharacterized protein n=1 Tax=Magnaporthiopsis poae (strain ATCC 64411 / 73-15) TaxID=644358 RepID=A0A0C4E840_MAGP6|nr:hypothetical protein MAPG_08728 [Magnaporthiopsis poae ATCC 64411]
MGFYGAVVNQAGFGKRFLEKVTVAAPADFPRRKPSASWVVTPSSSRPSSDPSSSSTGAFWRVLLDVLDTEDNLFRQNPEPGRRAPGTSGLWVSFSGPIQALYGCWADCR